MYALRVIFAYAFSRNCEGTRRASRGVSFSFGYFSLRQVREKYLGYRDQPRLVVAIATIKYHLTLPSPARRGEERNFSLRERGTTAKGEGTTIKPTPVVSKKPHIVPPRRNPPPDANRSATSPVVAATSG